MVTGQGEPSTRMVASSGCAEAGCTVRKATAIDGMFEAEIVVRPRTRAAITLGYENNVSLDIARVR